MEQNLFCSGIKAQGPSESLTTVPSFNLSLSLRWNRRNRWNALPVLPISKTTPNLVEPKILLFMVKSLYFQSSRRTSNLTIVPPPLQNFLLHSIHTISLFPLFPFLINSSKGMILTLDQRSPWEKDVWAKGRNSLRSLVLQTAFWRTSDTGYQTL